MNTFTNALSYIVFPFILIGWAYLTFEAIRSAWTGKFSYWHRKANGKIWPPVRAETPLRFWVVWTFLAGPFLFITLLMLSSLGIGLTQR